MVAPLVATVGPHIPERTFTGLSSSPFPQFSQVQHRLGDKVAEVRQAVLQDLEQLVRELQEDQEVALQALPAHVAAVYRQGSPKLRFQLLLLAWLLELCQFPGRHELWGFKLLGPVCRGSGWLSRQDFLAGNQALASTLRLPSAPSEHNEVRVAELFKERDLGRVQGPLQLELLGSPTQKASLRSQEASLWCRTTRFGVQTTGCVHSIIVP